MDSQVSTTLLNDILKFDGQPVNFAFWKDKIELARSSFEDVRFLQVIKNKLGNNASMFLRGLGNRADTVDKLLKELTCQYDQYSRPLYAHQKFGALKQSGSDLATHHSEIYALLRGMKTDLGTTDEMLRSGYVSSLNSKGLRRKLLSKMSDDVKKYSLEDLMHIAVNEERLNTMNDALTASTNSGSNSGYKSASAASASASAGETEQCSCYHAGKPQYGGGRQWQKTPGHLEKSARTNSIARSKDGPWCTIHEVASHDLADCRIRMKTSCRHCHETFEAGKYGSHIAQSCSGRRCHTCNRLGHIAKWCKQEESKSKREGSERPAQVAQKRPRNDTAPVSRTVNSAQTAPVSRGVGPDSEVDGRAEATTPPQAESSE
jgi:hypothetical protein